MRPFRRARGPTGCSWAAQTLSTLSRLRRRAAIAVEALPRQLSMFASPSRSSSSACACPRWPGSSSSRVVSYIYVYLDCAKANVLILFSLLGRLWYLAFSVGGVPTGPHLQGRTGDWLVSLGLGEYSSPAWVDARLSIVDGSPPMPLDSSSVASRIASCGLPMHPTSGKHRPPASLPIRTGSYQITPGGTNREIVVSLDKYLFGAALQNE